MAYQQSITKRNEANDDATATAVNSEKFYVAEWMDECYQQLAVPNPNLESLMEKIGEKLATSVKGQLDNSSKKQALFTLLGKQYVKQYFPSHKFEPNLLEPPKMTPENRVILMEDMSDWLSKELTVACKELGYNKAGEEGLKHAELGPFFKQASSVYEKQLEKRVQQIKANKAKHQKFKGSLGLDCSSQALGEGLLSVGLHDPFKMARILKTIQQRGFPLPDSLRSYVWSEFLFLRDGVKVNIVLTNIVKQKLQKFKTSVNQGCKELRIPRSTESPLHKSIEKAVMETYDHNVAMKLIDSDAHLIESTHVLNTAYVHSKNFSSPQVFWLCPLQLGLERGDLSEDDWKMFLAMHLDLFVRHAPLSQSDLFGLAQQVMDTLRSMDPYLHEHLGDTASKSVSVTTKDFPVDCFHQDKTESEKIAAEIASFSGKDLPSSRLPLFEDPTIFVRKWLLSLFVSVLSPPALLLMWDYFFLGKWDRRRLHDICLVLLGLLKPWFYRAKDFAGIKRVFFEEPSKLYTADIRKAWMHWLDRGAFDAIPKMNSNIIDKSSTAAGKS